MTHSRSPVVESSVHCSHCSYDLSGTAVGGSCPECGLSVAESLRRGAPERTSPRARNCMILGIVSLAACNVLGPLAVASYFAAMKEIESGGYTAGSRTMAKAGLIMGIIACTILGIVLFVLVDPWGLTSMP